MTRPICGSDWGYRVHLKLSELACDACLEAHRREWHWWVARKGQPQSLRPCGSLAAYKRHIRRGEQPCWPCRLANRRGEDLVNTTGEMTA